MNSEKRIKDKDSLILSTKNIKNSNIMSQEELFCLPESLISHLIETLEK